MPTIEELALALVNKVKAERSHPPAHSGFIDRDDCSFSEAICRTIEALDAERAAHAQFRQEVSDVARDAVAMLDEMAEPLLMGRNVKERLEKARSGLAPLIIAKPDPLVEVCADMGLGASVTAADDLRASLAKRGLKLVEVGDATEHVAYPGCYCADCVEGMPHERHNDLRGYIVGNGDRTKWRAWINGMPAWVDDPADATRYGFRSDANAVHAEDEDAWCVVKYEDVATPSARITGDKDRENPVEGAPTNRWLAIEVKRLRNVLRYITELTYVDHQSGNQNYEYLQGIADSALRINAHTDHPHD